MRLKNTSEKLFLSTLEACHPAKLIEEALSWKEGGITIHDDRFDEADPQAVFIVAFGKASLPMAEALKQKGAISDEHVCCITPEESADKSYAHQASHPVPDEKSLKATQTLLQFIKAIPDDAVVLAAISGGTSSFLCKPAKGIELGDLNRLNENLLKSGATIKEINAVRKHLSGVKGGKLLSYFKNSITLVDLVISDVPGDDLAVIGSGPTTPDASTFQDAYDTLLHYNLWKNAPEAVRNHIEKGLAGQVPETLKPSNDPLQNHTSYIVGSANLFARKLAGKAEKKGFKTWVAERAYNEPVEEVAEQVALKIKEPQVHEELRAFIFYGESTVKVTGGGKGGRNQQLALHGALQIDGIKAVAWLSAGTDGIDGPTDAAGAIVSDSTIQKVHAKGLEAKSFLKRNDAYHFHQQMGTLLKTGSTGNNVMDVVLVLKGKGSTNHPKAQ